MTERKLYGSTFGPYLYDDADLIEDADSEFPSMTYDASVSNGYHLCAGLRFLDTNQSNHLSLTWNDDDTANRTLQVTVNSGNRVFALHGNLTVESASLINQDVTTDANPTFAGVTLSDLTANTWVKADGNKALESVQIVCNNDVVVCHNDEVITI